MSVQNEAATKIQCGFRAFQARNKVATVAKGRRTKKFEAARSIQNRYRVHSAGNLVGKRRKDQNAAVTIQRVWRGRIARLHALDVAFIFERKEMVAVVLQSYARMWKAQHEADQQLAAQDSVSKVQAMWRGAKARDEVQLQLARQRGANMLQKVIRGHFGRKQFEDLMEHKRRFEYKEVLRDVASTKIQASFRGLTARKNSKDLRCTVVAIEDSKPITSAIDDVDDLTVKADVNVHPNANVNANANVEAEAAAAARANAEVDAAAKAKVEADVKTEADANAKAKAKAKAEAAAKAKAEADTKAAAKAKAEAATVKAKAERDAKAEADARTRTQKEADTNATANSRKEADTGEKEEKASSGRGGGGKKKKKKKGQRPGKGGRPDEDWDVLHGVNGMVKTKTGRYVRAADQ